MKYKRLIRKVLYTLLALFMLGNAMACFHAYKFTHFRPGLVAGTKDETKLSFTEKLSALFFGVSLPRPQNKLPGRPYETVILQSNKRLECWLMKADSALGTIVICHGYGSSKSAMLQRAAIFQRLHYNVLLPDFMGAGGSEGNACTIGYYEAEEVKTCVDYLSGKGETNIILAGTSMGAAAIMKAMHDDSLSVRAVILECPYGTMLRTVQNRFKMVGVPAFPLANLLTFWGGIENGFNAFSLNPQDYARSIHCPALLIYGEQDPKVSAEETATIFQNLAGPKRLLSLPKAGHANYLLQYEKEWTAAVDSLLKSAAITSGIHQNSPLSSASGVPGLCRVHCARSRDR